MRVLSTIGYEGLNIDGFVSLLHTHGIETVVDIRELPLSRKPGFSKKALADALDRSGLGYVHKVSLGCPKAIRNRYREDGDWGGYTTAFLEHLAKQNAAIDELWDLAKSSRCVLLCYEADYRHCHRSMVADALRVRSGTSIEHITATR